MYFLTFVDLLLGAFYFQKFLKVVSFLTCYIMKILVLAIGKFNHLFWWVLILLAFIGAMAIVGNTLPVNYTLMVGKEVLWVDCNFWLTVHGVCRWYPFVRIIKGRSLKQSTNMWLWLLRIGQQGVVLQIIWSATCLREVIAWIYLS